MKAAKQLKKRISERNRKLNAMYHRRAAMQKFGVSKCFMGYPKISIYADNLPGY